MSLKSIVVAVLLVAIAYLLYLAFRRKKAPATRHDAADEPPKNLADLTILDARLGDLLTIHGAGDAYEDLSFTVDRRHRYESGDDISFELSGKYKNRRVFLEYCDGDELEVLLTASRPLTIEQIGVTEDILVDMDEKPATANTVAYDNETWRYESSAETGFFKDGEGDGEGFYVWEFVSGDGRRKLVVEKWLGEPFEVYVADRIPATDVTVFRG
jgi:hypothetical protein